MLRDQSSFNQTGDFKTIQDKKERHDPYDDGKSMNIDSQTENSNDQYEFEHFIKNREAKVLGSKTQIFSDTKSMKVAPTAAMMNQVAPFNQRDGYTEFNDANEQSEVHIPNVGLESPDLENTA